MTKREKNKIKIWLNSLRNEKIDFMDLITLLKELIK